jgi:hypothetical protein
MDGSDWTWNVCVLKPHETVFPKVAWQSMSLTRCCCGSDESLTQFHVFAVAAYSVTPPNLPIVSTSGFVGSFSMSWRILGENGWSHVAASLPAPLELISAYLDPQKIFFLFSSTVVCIRMSRKMRTRTKVLFELGDIGFYGCERV